VERESASQSKRESRVGPQSESENKSEWSESESEWSESKREAPATERERIALSLVELPW
jgi:hypothetical protein